MRNEARRGRAATGCRYGRRQRMGQAAPGPNQRVGKCCAAPRVSRLSVVPVSDRKKPGEE